MRAFARTVLSFALSCLAIGVYAQRKKISLKDSLDGKLDLSDFLIDANGFVPVPYIVTDKALGGFGGGLIPVFIKSRPPYIDTIRGKVVRTPVAPDITGGILLYTVNGTWIADAFRIGTFVKSRIKYMVNAGYSNINMTFYRDVQDQGEKNFDFNFRAIPLFVQFTRRLGFSKWYAGIKYLFLHTEIRYKGDKQLPEELGIPEKYSRQVSVPGALVELDSRDNIFTPDKGIKFHVDGQWSDEALGSDYNYWRMNYYAYLYKEFSRRLTGGWRIDGQQTFNDPPFFLLPYIDMRGIPALRYQGKADLLTEVEARWNFGKAYRWSLMAFGGLGKAFDDWEDFGSENLVYSYGTGFRYLLARKFKLRIGLDVAGGPPGSWGYYIVFGSAWLK